VTRSRSNLIEQDHIHLIRLQRSSSTVEHSLLQVRTPNLPIAHCQNGASSAMISILAPPFSTLIHPSTQFATPFANLDLSSLRLLAGAGASIGCHLVCFKRASSQLVCNERIFNSCLLTNSSTALNFDLGTILSCGVSSDVVLQVLVKHVAQFRVGSEPVQKHF
jgi:hypothetical protein